MTTTQTAQPATHSDLFNQTAKMMQEAAKGYGSSGVNIDPQKIIDATQRLEKLIEDERQARIVREKQLAGMRGRIRKAEKKIRAMTGSEPEPAPQPKAPAVQGAHIAQKDITVTPLKNIIRRRPAPGSIH